ncbi:hypothetical protein GCM10010191_45730 [Actinomadura vinacea]|uniref:Uncharacterized protein n=2 Tax=Actinomadura vinacea TaxID=115336 RepID=A0ABN3JDJ2_9ACTN
MPGSGTGRVGGDREIAERLDVAKISYERLDDLALAARVRRGCELWRWPGSGRHMLALQGEQIGDAEHAGFSAQWKDSTMAGVAITVDASRRGA